MGCTPSKVLAVGLARLEHSWQEVRLVLLAMESPLELPVSSPPYDTILPPPGLQVDLLFKES